MACRGCDALPPPYAFKLALEGADGTAGSHNKALCVSCNNKSESKDNKQSSSSSSSSSSSKSTGKRPAKHKWVSWELQLNGELVVRT
ncbi:hypothetical protein SAMD00023353_6000410 [Rosellinia necatrix]|uniref:Uncharacterized protein n=1 Tax=Rosellinia necatrix TaxID=77044 RepID=A0A1S8AAA1_ROSNE|nr:hypothetical protein SAMD00023353_6000410 [Rosellinia necatrix]